MTASFPGSRVAAARWMKLSAVLVLVLIGLISLHWLPDPVQSGTFGVVDLQLAMHQQRAREILQSFRTTGSLLDASKNLAQDNIFVIAYVLCGAFSLLGLGLVGRWLKSQWAMHWISAGAIGMLLGAGACDYFGENPRLEKLIGWAQGDSFADSSRIPVNIHELTAFAVAKFAMFLVAVCLWLVLIVGTLRLSFLASDPASWERHLRKGDE